MNSTPPTSLRHQLTLFVPVQQAPAIEDARKQLDPVQAGLIAAHVTLCREDELAHWLPAETVGAVMTDGERCNRLQSHLDALRRSGHLTPLTLGFGEAEMFDGHGWRLPCTAGEEAFMALRRTLLAREEVRLARAHLTLAHPRNPRAPGNSAALASSIQLSSAHFRVLSLIAQRDGGPWQSLATWPLNSGNNDFLHLGLPQAAAGLTPHWLQASDAPALQSFYAANPDYFLLVEGQPAEPSAAWEDIAGPLPPGWPYADRCSIAWRDGQGRIQGFCTVVQDLLEAGVWHIGLFLMASALHGQAIARELHASLEQWAIRSGARWLRLGVVYGNERGRRFWARNGYIEVRQRHDVPYGERRHTLGVLVKPLAGNTVEQYLASVPRDRPDA